MVCCCAHWPNDLVGWWWLWLDALAKPCIQYTTFTLHHKTRHRAPIVSCRLREFGVFLVRAFRQVWLEIHGLYIACGIAKNRQCFGYSSMFPNGTTKLPSPHTIYIYVDRRAFMPFTRLLKSLHSTNAAHVVDCTQMGDFL